MRGSSELLAGVESVLLLSLPEAMKPGGMGRTALKVVKNRLGQAGARLQFTIVNGEPTNADCVGVLRSSLHPALRTPGRASPAQTAPPGGCRFGRDDAHPDDGR